MTDGYIVTYTSDTDETTASGIERLLRQIDAEGVTHNRSHRRFFANPKSGDIADAHELRRHLAPVSEALVSILPFRADKDQTVSNRWNVAFTNMLRETNSSAWGNWDLNPSIRAGAVGILDPDTGSFTPVATLAEAVIIENTAYQSWELESESASFSESEIEFEGGYFDPSTNTEVKVGLEASWSFASANSIVSRGTISRRAWVDDFGVLLDKDHFWDWFLAKAKSVGFANDRGVIQGFGMITSTTNCIGCLNIGSIEDKSSFSLDGSVSGVTAMTGGGKASAGVKGSYKDKRESKAFNSHTWPVATNSVEPGAGEVALTYQFTTFDGTTIMPTWARRIGNFTINFDNGHGGTYIGRCRVQYSVPGGTDPVVQDVSVPGGQSGRIGNIPINAYDLNIHIDFMAGGDSFFDVPSPVTEWLTGACTIDLGGVWPWGSTANLRVS
jgi:hypothetical protein